MKSYITCISIFCGAFVPAAQAADIRVQPTNQWNVGWTTYTADTIAVTGSGMMGRDGGGPLVMEASQAWQNYSDAPIQLVTGSGMMGGGGDPLQKARLDRAPEMIRETTQTEWGAYTSSGMEMSAQVIRY